jgi:hypothetical protein
MRPYLHLIIVIAISLDGFKRYHLHYLFQNIHLVLIRVFEAYLSSVVI